MIPLYSNVIKSVANNFTDHCAGGQFGKTRSGYAYMGIVNSVPEIGYEIIHYFIKSTCLSFSAARTCTYVIPITCMYMRTFVFADVTCTYVYTTEHAFVGNRPISSVATMLNCDGHMLNIVNGLRLR